MNLFDLLIGKKVKVMTDMKVEVILTVESVNENKNSVDLEPSTAANDWWPATRDWSTFTVKFTNGAYKTYDNLKQINIVE